MSTCCGLTMYCAFQAQISEREKSLLSCSKHPDKKRKKTWNMVDGDTWYEENKAVQKKEEKEGKAFVVREYLNKETSGLL